ncbi:hypothetical protein [Paenibacillus aquistagni]|uniref:hypothetical protein n=1 Tax=Paenibacillus aquistagni TaxID=1852522 RepID=UPI000B511475|nr:hypothetical protein [Paenibacillus aquistagni]
MKLQDALFNWLQMDIVSKNRPQDQAALDTLYFFSTMLEEDHSITNIRAEEDSTQDDTYTITYELDGQQSQVKIDRERAEQLWRDIESNPKYNE